MTCQIAYSFALWFIQRRPRYDMWFIKGHGRLLAVSKCFLFLLRPPPQRKQAMTNFIQNMILNYHFFINFCYEKDAMFDWWLKSVDLRCPMNVHEHAGCSMKYVRGRSSNDENNAVSRYAMDRKVASGKSCEHVKKER